MLSAARLELAAGQLQDGRYWDRGANGSEVDGGPLRDNGLTLRLLTLSLTQLLASFAGLGQFAVAFLKGVRSADFEHILEGDIADGGAPGCRTQSSASDLPAMPAPSHDATDTLPRTSPCAKVARQTRCPGSDLLSPLSAASATCAPLCDFLFRATFTPFLDSQQ